MAYSWIFHWGGGCGEYIVFISIILLGRLSGILFMNMPQHVINFVE